MASRLLHVMRNKNRFEKEERKKRQVEVEKLRREGLFRVALNTQLATIRACLDDPNVVGVVVEVDESSYVDFGGAFGYEEMKDFQIRQYGKPTVFRFKRKEF